MRIWQLQRDVNEREEAELRRLEGGSQVGGDVMLRGDAAEPPVAPAGGAVVSGAVQRVEERGALVEFGSSHVKADMLDTRMN